MSQVTQTPSEPTQRTLANRANALKSTGPTSAAGKQRVSMNAFKHGLTGQKLLLQAGEFVSYFKLGVEFTTELKPVGSMEEQIVQRLIDCNWRLNRCVALENNILENGILKSDSGNSVNAPVAVVSIVGQADAWTGGTQAFEALGRHETRISRMMHKLQLELEQIQARRLKRAGDQDSFVLEQCRAWRYYDDLLTYHRGMEETPQQQPIPMQKPAQAMPAVADSEVALNCKITSPDTEERSRAAVSTNAQPL